MNMVIGGGTGFIGQYLVTDLLNQGAKVAVVGRNLDHIKKIFANRVRALTWQDIENHSQQIIEQFNPEIVINLAGADIGSARWSSKRKQEIIQSRVNTTALLADFATQLKSPSPLFLNAGGIGIYGLQPTQANGLPPAMDEQTPIPGENATDFLAQVGWLWDRATKKAETKSGLRVVKMRFAPVLGKNGGILAKLLLAYKLGLGGKIASGQQAFCWVTIDDLIKAIYFIINHDISGPINIVSPQAVTQYQFAKILAKVLHRPCWFCMPAWVIKLLFGQMGEELLLQSQHVKPTVLLNKKFIFDYPDLELALKHIL